MKQDQMTVIESAGQYSIYDGQVAAANKLDKGTYRVHFNPQVGHYLTRISDPKAGEAVVFGKHLSKVNKIVHFYEKQLEEKARGAGVIFSGAKGIGKSLSARLLSIAMLDKGFPVIQIDAFVPGLNQFLSSIKQPMLVTFDEFEKNFDRDEQEKLLNLFDGTSSNGHLYLITCNEIAQVSPFILNRPGRFHYHIRFAFLGKEEIVEYMTYHLEPEFHGAIKDVVSFSVANPLNYDMLRAICSELVFGETFSELIQDMNIINTSSDYVDIIIQHGSSSYGLRGRRSGDKIEIDDYAYSGDTCFKVKGTISVTGALHHPDVALSSQGYIVLNKETFVGSMKYQVENDEERGIDSSLQILMKIALQPNLSVL